MWVCILNRRIALQNTSITLIAFMVGVAFSITCAKKLYCDVITRSRLQLINTSINTFFSKLCAFLVQQRRKKKVNDGCKEARWCSR